MSNTFKKTGLRGFTLIELLVVIAIIGLLSTIIAAPIQNARKKARDSKKIAEIKAVQLALDQYAEANIGSYPLSLIKLEPVYMPLIPSFASTSLKTVSNRDKFAYTPFTYAGIGQATTTFAYHVGVHLENFSQGLDNDRDCYGADNSSAFQTVLGTTTCAYYPSTSIFGGYNTTNFTVYTTIFGGPVPPNNYATGMIPGTDATSGLPPAGYAMTGSGAGQPVGEVNDFNGDDNDTTKCNATTDCVFDLTAQQ